MKAKQIMKANNSCKTNRNIVEYAFSKEDSFTMFS